MRHVAVTSLILAAPFCPAWHAAHAQDQDASGSPAVHALAMGIEAGKPGALQEFWRGVERTGTPLVESHPHRDSSRITFVYRSTPDLRSVRLSSGLNAQLADGIGNDFGALGRMQRLPDTDVWYLSVVVGNDVRVSYRLELTTLDGATAEQMDPLNPRVYRPDRAALRASRLELPDAPPQPWHARRESGSWRQRKVTDSRGQENDVFVYMPGGFDVHRAEPYAVLIGLDSYSFGVAMPGALLLDHLVATGAIPPMVMLAANMPRGDGLDQLERTADYVADRLLPQLRTEFNLASDPRRIVISGTSRRGLVAAYVAFARPLSVGNLLSLSGSFYWKPDGETEYEWLARRFATDSVRPLRVFLAAGNLETVVTPANRGQG